MSRIEQAKEDLFEFIDNLNITEANYDNILYLYQNCDNALFTKIIEEVKNGNLVFNDFIRMFKENTEFDKSIEAQQKLYTEHTLLRERLITLTNMYREMAVEKISKHYGTFEETDRLKMLTTQYVNKTGTTINYKASDIDKENIIMSIINKETSDPLDDLYRINMLNKILDESAANATSDLIDSMLLSINDYIVPVDYNHIVLSDTDREFMKTNNMSEDDMKKLKSFSAYISTYFE